ncbi:MAG: GNAT family N-acetyltransferase [Solirubrobacterales bacterium]
MPAGDHKIRRAEPADGPEVARMLHDFNTEFNEPTPSVEVLAERAARMIAAREIIVLLGGDGPDGLALFSLRPSLWSDGLDAYLQELYVVPPRRGEGIGRALLEATLEAAREAGASHIDLNTSDDDTAAIGLYESSGFTNREGRPDGPPMRYYERDL